MRYVTHWRNKFLTTEAKSIGEMAAALEAAAAQLRGMEQDGVRLDPDSGVEDDYAELYTESARVAERYGMEQEG